MRDGESRLSERTRLLPEPHQPSHDSRRLRFTAHRSFVIFSVLYNFLNLFEEIPWFGVIIASVIIALVTARMTWRDLSGRRENYQSTDEKRRELKECRDDFFHLMDDAQVVVNR